MRKVVLKESGRHGWFHGFFQFASNGEQFSEAIIEFEDGTVDNFGITQIRFVSQPAESDNAVGQALHTTGNKSKPADICPECGWENPRRYEDNSWKCTECGHKW